MNGSFTIRKIVLNKAPKSTLSRYRGESALEQIAKIQAKHPELFIETRYRSKHAYPYEVEYADDFEEFIEQQPWFRDNSLKGMFSSPIHHNNDHMENRLFHLLSVKGIAKRLAKGMGLNEDLAGACGFVHDDHVSHGHQGEKEATRYAMDKQIGYITHNGLGAINFLFKNNVPKEFRWFLQQRYGITEEQAIKRTKWLSKVAESALKHDGEAVGRKYDYDHEVSDEELKEHIINMFVINRYSKRTSDEIIEGKDPANDRLIASAKEVAVIKKADVISAVVSDYLDGRKMGIIPAMPDEEGKHGYADYIEIFEALGMGEEFLNRHANKYYVALKLRCMLENNLIKHSGNTREIQFSPEVESLVNKLLDVNREQIVPEGLSGDDYEKYPRAKGRLIYKLANELKKRGTLNRIVRGDYLSKAETEDPNDDMKKLLKFVNNLPKDYIIMAQEIVDRSFNNQLKEEVELAARLNRGEGHTEDSKGMFEGKYKNYILRVTRMQEDLRTRYGTEDPTEEQKEAYIKELKAESEMSVKEFRDLHKDKIEEITRQVTSELRKKAPHLLLAATIFPEAKKKRAEYFEDRLMNEPSLKKMESRMERLHYWIAEQRVLRVPDKLLIHILHSQELIDDEERQKLEAIYGTSRFRTATKEHRKHDNLTQVIAEAHEALEPGFTERSHGRD